MGGRGSSRKSSGVTTLWHCCTYGAVWVRLYEDEIRSVEGRDRLYLITQNQP